MMRVLMVKKRLADGAPCRKCDQAEEMLRRRGHWGRIDRVVFADEGEPDSEGFRLGREHGVDSAPFFLVEDGGPPVVYRSVLKLMRERFGAGAPQHTQPPPSEAELQALAREFERRTPQDIVAWVLERFATRCAIAFSGAEDVALIDMAARSGFDFTVFSLDTGRLHPETYRFIDEVRSHYGVEIELVSPDRERLEPFVRTKGLFSFYEDGHEECCGIRKVEPLRRVLAQHDAWINGQRKDQSPATRADIPVLQLDGAFEGKGGALLKANPLANWSSAQTWRYLRDNRVPYNPLHERGFVSIGCEPCTRAVHPGQHEREGRWWWEESTQKECGLHSVPPPKPR